MEKPKKLPIGVENFSDLETPCQETLRQIIDTRYTELFEQQDVKKILKYGIACRKKTAKSGWKFTGDFKVH